MLETGGRAARGALVVDFAALDAQFDYPRLAQRERSGPARDDGYFAQSAARSAAAAGRNGQTAVTASGGGGDTTTSVGERGELELVGCATLDASWDRGTGTHVALPDAQLRAASSGVGGDASGGVGGDAGAPGGGGGGAPGGARCEE